MSSTPPLNVSSRLDLDPLAKKRLKQFTDSYASKVLFDARELAVRDNSAAIKEIHIVQAEANTRKKDWAARLRSWFSMLGTTGFGAGLSGLGAELMSNSPDSGRTIFWVSFLVGGILLAAPKLNE